MWQRAGSSWDSRGGTYCEATGDGLCRPARRIGLRLLQRHGKQSLGERDYKQLSSLS